MILPESLLHDSLTVTPADDGRVAVTVLLPSDLVRDYCRFLESLAGFFQSIHRKSFIASVESRAAARALDHGPAVAAYASALVAAYDAFTASGLSRNEAIKRIAADLRAKSHPWCAPHLVRSQLIASGRAGRSGRPASAVQAGVNDLV